MALEREINVDTLEIDGEEVTATADEINALDGLTATVAELNTLDGVTSTAAELNILDGVTSTAAELNYLDIATLGTGAASKAIVLDAGEDYAWPATGYLTYGGSALAATGAEINRQCDMSIRVVNLTGTANIVLGDHESKELYVTGTAAATYTLPEATGSGARLRFTIGEVNTNGTVIQTADTTNCGYYGSVNILDLDSNAQTAYAPASTDDLITLNGTTSGGQIGDFIELFDIATDKWRVLGFLQCPTGSNVATPFSGT